MDLYSNNLGKTILIIFLICCKLLETKSELASPPQLSNNNQGPELLPSVRVNKCCEENELYVGKYCTDVGNTSETLWKPIFSTASGQKNVQINNYRLVTGFPDCGAQQPWSIYHYQASTDRLLLLPSGTMRHYFDRTSPSEDGTLLFEEESGDSSSLYHDYQPGKYCMEKRVDGKEVREFAWVCAPSHDNDWTTTEFVMRNIVSPITHGIGIVCLLTIAIIYFVMPTLRDLVGNIITSMCMCLIVSQAADLVRLLTVFNSHISLLITETICYVSLLGAFFWLNSLGYYICKTFKSRNVFLRITDGKKYCYYSAYTWTCTLILGALAVFAHFTLDYEPQLKAPVKPDDQEQIGSLGIIIFFVPVAFTILMDVFFFASTLKIINRMHTYGRIHHKLRHSFRMFLMLLIVMTLTWIFFMMSFFKFDGLVNCYIIINAVQGPLILYICVFNQKHVSYLIKKTCCYKNCFCKSCQPLPETEWGDEMTAMNAGIYGVD